MPFRWIESPADAWPALTATYIAAIRAGIEQIAQMYAPEIETWMKQNAPWVDRTGNARQTLHAEVYQLASATVIMLAHGVEYGIFLELAHGGRFQIIGPAIDYFAPRIWRSVQTMMS